MGPASPQFDELPRLVRSANDEIEQADLALTELSPLLPIGPRDAQQADPEAARIYDRRYVRRIEEILGSVRQSQPDAEAGEAEATVLREYVNLEDSLRLGSARITIFEERLSVSWGYVDRMYIEPLVTPSETPLLRLALIALDRSHGGNGLVRENHHSGYHYHYVDARKRRSDVLFTFGVEPPEPEYPVTWERHGEGHAKFSPKVTAWGYPKRHSVNLVCCANAAKLGRTAFMTASKEAEFLLPM